MSSDRDPAERPLLLIDGRATPEEVAAVLLALRTRAAAPSTAPRSRSLWSLPARQLRPALIPGRGAWRASALPR